MIYACYSGGGYRWQNRTGLKTDFNTIAGANAIDGISAYIVEGIPGQSGQAAGKGFGTGTIGCQAVIGGWIL